MRLPYATTLAAIAIASASRVGASANDIVTVASAPRAPREYALGSRGIPEPSQKKRRKTERRINGGRR